MMMRARRRNDDDFVVVVVVVVIRANEVSTTIQKERITVRINRERNVVII